MDGLAPGTYVYHRGPHALELLREGALREQAGFLDLGQELGADAAVNVYLLSDLGPAVAGSIGIAPSANINPERSRPSMFEPVHGSAPDIAGKGIANPIGQIWSGAMMLDHLGQGVAAQAVEQAIERVLTDPKALTPDMGGPATTESLGSAIAAAIEGGA